MSERLKELRKLLGLTQQEFADRLGIKRNAVTNYEVGRNNPADMVVSLICREFSVSEEWLRTGDGDPFIVKTRDQEIEEMVNEILKEKPESFRRSFVRALAALDPNGWKALENFVDSIYERREKEGAAPSAGSNPYGLNEEHRKQVDDLAAQLKAEEIVTGTSGASQSDISNASAG